MNSYKNLKIASENQIMTVTFNRPQTLNSVTPEFMDELGSLCDALSDDADIRTLIFTGAGKGFCSGLDLGVFGQIGNQISLDDLRGLIRRWQAVFSRLENVPQITIAGVNGPCLGAGVELILSCDFRISSSRALFGLPEVKYGIIPDLGGITRLTRMVGPAWAKEMVLRARNVSAMEALRIGLVNRVADPGDMIGIARNWAQQFGRLPPKALSHAKRLINSAYDSQLNQALLAAEYAQLQLLGSDELRAALTALQGEQVEDLVS